jgi:hypothetical protein
VGSNASVNNSTLSSGGNTIAGSYTQSASGLTGADADNYSFGGFTSPTFNYTINKLALSGPSIASSSSTYGSSLNPGTVSFGNILSGDIVGSNASVNNSTLSSGGNTIAGSYTQSASGLTGADAGNYSFGGFTSPTFNYTINKLALSGTSIASSSSTYGSPLNPGVVNFANALNGDQIGSSASVNVNGNPIVGTYTQTATGLSGSDAGNYSFGGFTTPTANYTINQLPVTTNPSSNVNSISRLALVIITNILSGNHVVEMLNSSISSSNYSSTEGGYSPIPTNVNGSDDDENLEV